MNIFLARSRYCKLTLQIRKTSTFHNFITSKVSKLKTSKFVKILHLYRINIAFDAKTFSPPSPSGIHSLFYIKIFLWLAQSGQLLFQVKFGRPF